MCSDMSIISNIYHFFVVRTFKMLSLAICGKVNSRENLLHLKKFASFKIIRIQLHKL